MKKSTFIVLVCILVFSCRDRIAEKSGNAGSQDKLLLSVLWFQRSAEMQALFHQGYNCARESLAEKLKDKTGGKPAAVIMDIDETVLDNSPVEAMQVLKDMPFSDSLWVDWVKKESAVTLPGAAEFIEFARKNGVEVFYVTNREMPEEFLPTLENLRKAGLPFADSIHLILKSDESAKEKRRKMIAEKYNILLLIGDNLADFDAVFDNRGEDLGKRSVIENSQKFGRDFIILPNPMYGPWINAAIKGTEGKSEGEKMKGALVGY